MIKKAPTVCELDRDARALSVLTSKTFCISKLTGQIYEQFFNPQNLSQKIKERKRKIRKEKKKKRSKKRKREKKRLTIYSYILRIYSHILNQKEKERNPNPKFFVIFFHIFVPCYARCMVISLTTRTFVGV